MNFKLKTQNRKLRTDSGFTLVETMVAIFVLMIAVIAPMSIAAQALATARYAKDQVTAFYLAQEGIELVRNIRDNNALSGGVWNGGVLGNPDGSTEDAKFCYSTKGCRINPIDLQVNICKNDTDTVCSPLYLNSNNIYNYDTTGSKTIFTRTINIIKTSTDEIKVSSTISWKSNSILEPNTFTITDMLFNWP